MPLLEQINGHLERNGIIVAVGSINIIDASVIEAKQSRKRKGKDGNNTQDKEAAFIKNMTYTKGSVHDSQEFDELLGVNQKQSAGKDLIKTPSEVYADSAYANKLNDKKFGKQNNKILHRAYRNKPLTKEQKQDNKQRSSIRYVVERTFGLLKQHHGLGKARYLGLERNKARVQLIAMSHNLKTGMNIFKRMRSLKDRYAQ
jgi:IS5 family transposase